MKVLSVVHWSVALPRTGYSKRAHAAHGLGGETLAGQAFQRHVTDICHVTQAVRGPLNRPTRSGSPPNHPIREAAKGWFFNGTFIGMRFQRGTIWLKSGREKSPLPPFAKGGWIGSPPLEKGG